MKNIKFVYFQIVNQELQLWNLFIFGKKGWIFGEADRRARVQKKKELICVPIGSFKFRKFWSSKLFHVALVPMNPCKLHGHAWVMGDGWGLEPWPLAAAQECHHRCWRSPSASFASSRIQFWRYENNFAPLLCSVCFHQHRLRLFEHRFIAFFRSHFGPV